MSGHHVQEEIRQAVAREREQHGERKAEPKGAGDQDGGDGRGPGYYDQLKLDFDDNHLGDARRFSTRFGGRLVFDNIQGRWFRFNHTHWIEDIGRRHLHCLTEIAQDYKAQSGFYAKKMADLVASVEYKDASQTKQKDMLSPLLQKKKAWEARAKELKDPTRIKKALDLASVCVDGFLGVLGKEWNPDPNLFATANKVINLRNGKALAPDPSLYINRASAVAWNGLHAECEMWDTFLQQVFNGDEELIKYVQKCVGYWLTGFMTHQEFYCLWGPQGRNGKGVFFRTIRKVMGSYFQTIPPKFLLDEKTLQATDKPDQVLVALEHTRLACASEAPKRARFSEGAIKALSGGDPITCRGMWASNLTEYTPKFKLLFVTNRVPSVAGDDKAFQDRLRIIKFSRTFKHGVEPDTEKGVYPMDPQLEFKLHTQENLSGILAWAVRGAIDFCRSMDLTPPDSVLATTADYMRDNDFAGEFIEQCLEVTEATESDARDHNRTQMKVIYEVFQRWCKEEKSIPESKIWSQNALGKDFTNRTELHKVPPRNVVFYNVRIKNDWLNNKGQPNWEF